MKYDITDERLLEYFNNTLSSEEEIEILEWRNSSAENRQRFDSLYKGYLQMRGAVRERLIKGNYSAIGNRIGKPRRSRMGRIVAAAVLIPAAVIVVVVVLFRFGSSGNHPIDFSALATSGNMPILELSDGSQHIISMADSTIMEKDGTQLSVVDGGLVYQNNNVEEVEVVYNKLIIPRGADSHRIQLGDGSVVWLNADSKLEYPSNFMGGERRVILMGEAFFQVVNDDNKPFIVESGAQSVTVLGTEFNISVYPGEDIVTTLVSGKVGVDPDNIERVILAPGEQSRYDVESVRIDKATVKVNEFISWKNGQISIENNTFAEALMKLSRKFDVEFEIADDQLKDKRMRGDIPADENFEIILSVLEQAVNVKFKPTKDGKIKVEKN